MKKITIPAALASGFADGALIGLSMKTGVEPSREGISMLVLEAMCKNPVTGGVSVCGWIWFFGAFFLVIGLLAMFEDITVNGPLYLVGLAVGAVFMLGSG